MAQRQNQTNNMSLSVPAGVLAGAIAVGLAGIAYLVLSGGNKPAENPASAAGRTARSGLRKVGLMGLAAMIENDATRKIVVATLRTMARWS